MGGGGVRFNLAKYVQAASKELPSLQRKHVRSHSFRHTVGVHMAAVLAEISAAMTKHDSLQLTRPASPHRRVSLFARSPAEPRQGQARVGVYSDTGRCEI
jgi:integrase